MKFPEFNRETNPNDEPVYTIRTPGGWSLPLRYKEAIKIASHDPDALLYWTIPNGYFAIGLKDDSLVGVAQRRNEYVVAIKNGKDVFIICKGAYNRTTKDNILACGISADTYAHSKSGNRILLPWKPKTNRNPAYASCELLYANSPISCPCWLRPLSMIGKDPSDGLDVPIVGNAHKLLQAHLARLKTFAPYEKEEILDLINNEFCSPKLTSDEIKQLLEDQRSYLHDQFFEKGEFKHWALGDYAIEACAIKRDSRSNALYYYDSRRHIYVSDEGFLQGYLTRLVPQLKDYQKQETIKYILSYLYEDKVEFDSNPFTVVFKNGVMDISTGHFEPMDQDHLESIMISANYDPGAHSDTVDEYFRTATCGKPEIEKLLYEAIGYSMLKTSELQKAFVLVGPAGRNGKSTFLDLIKAVLGKDNCASVSFKDLANSFRASMLDRKLASMAGDISAQTLTDTDLFKSIATGEDVTVEKKYKDAYMGAFFATLFFSCNKLPRTPDTSGGFYRRFVIIPFLADLNDVSAVDGMAFKKKLLSQESVDYVAYKAIKAITNVLNTTKEFTIPEEVKAMLEEYKVMNSSVLSWFKEEFKNDRKKLESKPLPAAYMSYSNWCNQSNKQSMSKPSFIDTVKAEIGIVFTDK